jgi:hypothetical protein
MILVSGGSKQHGTTSILSRAPWLHPNMAEKQKGNQLQDQGAGVQAKKEEKGRVVFYNIPSHGN